MKRLNMSWQPQLTRGGGLPKAKLAKKIQMRKRLSLKDTLLATALSFKIGGSLRK